MAENVAFTLQVTYCADEKHHGAAIELHRGCGEQCNYGWFEFADWKPSELGGTRHQVTMALIELMSQLGKLDDDALDRLIRPVVKPS